MNYFTAFACVICIALCCHTPTARAQQPGSPDRGVISGHVTDAGGNPLPGASVYLEETEQSVTTDDRGSYRLSGIPEGTYTLTATTIGFARQTRTVSLQAGESLRTDLSLRAATAALQEVEVIGRSEKSYKNTFSFSGTKTETALKYIPQAISYVTKEVIQDQQAFRTMDIVKNVSGLNVFSTNNYDFTLRGFRTHDVLLNGLRLTGDGWNQSVLPNVERVEVIKGPASALFANTDPGGTINIVTKKPLDENRKALNFATGSYNTYRLAADFTGPMNKEKTLLYRLNLAYQNAGSFRKLQGGQNVVAAPSVSFIPDDKTRVNFDLVYSLSLGRLDRGQPIFGASAGTKLNSTPISFAIGKENDFENETFLNATLSLQRKISDHITFNASYLKSLYHESLLEHRTANRYAMDADGDPVPTLMEMQTTRRLDEDYTDNLSSYFVFDFNTGPLKHKILAGYDHINYISPDGNSTYNAYGFINADSTGIVLTPAGKPAAYDPEQRSRYLIRNNMPVPNVPYFNLENPDYSFSDISRYFNTSEAIAPARYYVNSVYVQEQLQWGKIRALLGFRQEFYTDLLNYTRKDEQTVNQHAFIPRIGLVYTPVEAISLYGTFTEGYQPQDAATIGDPERYGGPFDPLISNMVEAGAKTELFRKRLALNLAVYRIEENNVLQNANAPGNPDQLRQIGQQRSEGIELDAYGQVTHNFSLTANFAYNKATVTRSDNPDEIGEQLPNAPRAQGGFWAKYLFDGKALKGLGIALGSNFVTRRNTLDAKTNLQLPGYIVADGALYYTVDKFRLSVNLNNIFNKTHWLGGYDYNRLFPGTPRNFLVGVGYTF
ncbi:TonB-dependent receptor [Compostibacter hankyongensis]|uniref:TonB-dependent siderophore receptor n=1 Tax=Compostibacter hankyongensis TaxID=1007089 RepID=A0ABP8FNI5_9BACT